jgi:lauroyl/myristoyl acyltransferase
MGAHRRTAALKGHFTAGLLPNRDRTYVPPDANGGDMDSAAAHPELVLLPKAGSSAVPNPTRLATLVRPEAVERHRSLHCEQYDGCLDAALARGCGVIFAVPHMGSWDVAGSLAGVLGYPIYAVAAGFPGSLEDAVVTTRQRFGLKVIPLGRSAVRPLLAALKSNAVVALLCDLPHGPGIEVEFFGRPAVVPGGPASLALKTGARLIPACQWRTGPGSYHVLLDKALDLGEDDARGLMQRVVRRFEDFIRRRPDQWYAFRPLFQA